LPVSACPADGYPASAARTAGCVPGPGWLAFAFIKEGTGNPALFIAKPDGSCMQRVTSDDSFYGGPSFFPGGKRLAYSTTRSGINRLYTRDLETGVEQPLETAYVFSPAPAAPEVLEASTPSVSPDGLLIAFGGTRAAAPAGSDLFTIPAAGGNLLRITSDPRSAATSPRWSPDGSRLYFLTYQAGPLELFQVQSDGTSPTRITTDSASSSRFDLTADGSALVYARFSDTGSGSLPTELVSLELTTGTIRVISVANEADPAVDATATSVAVSRRSGTGYDLYLLDYATGAVKTRLTACPGQAFGAVFAR
jgi:Tol biopolymer transport system component